MRTRGLSAIVVAVLTASLTACSIDHTSDAIGLEKDLAQMPGVTSVNHSYESGELIAGSITVQVVMSPDATTEETLALIDAAYDEFASTYHRDDATLAVHHVGSTVLVHTHDPRADIDDILAVARFALDAPRPGERMRADIVAHHGEFYDDLVSEARLNLDRGSSEADIMPRIDDLAASGALPEGTDIWVLSADGAGIGGSRGLPTADDLAMWRDLSSVPTPGTIRVEFGPYQLYSDLDEYGFANITLRATPAPTKEQLAAMKMAHMAALAARSETYVYNVTVNGEDAIWLRRHGN
jgi:hypothetical protein